MRADVTHVTVLVTDTDEAIEWYTDSFGFELRADDTVAPGMRWVTVAPEGSDVEVVLQEPTDEAFGSERAAALRDRVGQGTTTVLGVADCAGTVETLRDRGVEVTGEPEEMPWGVSAVVTDCYGNPYNLLERTAGAM
jgi:predicted enzyme related to lactoylglutathione lyase